MDNELTLHAISQIVQSDLAAVHALDQMAANSLFACSLRRAYLGLQKKP